MNRSVAATWASPLLTLPPLLGCAANFANGAEAAGEPAAVPIAEVSDHCDAGVGSDRLRAASLTVFGARIFGAWGRDLRTASATVAARAPPGGDTGPAGSVPSLWGLHEFDAFLLVVDGVPWGGAFNPAVPTLDLNDVERIEIMKGAAPVMFGATSFVGEIHVIRYLPARAPTS